MNKEEVKVKALEYCMDGMKHFEGLNEDEQHYFIKVCSDTFKDAYEGKSYNKMEYNKARLDLLIRTLNDKLLDEYTIAEVYDPVGYKIIQHDHLGKTKSRAIAKIDAFGKAKVLVDDACPAKEVIDEWSKQEKYVTHVSCGIGKPLRTAKLAIDIDDSKLKPFMDELDHMASKVMEVYSKDNSNELDKMLVDTAKSLKKQIEDNEDMVSVDQDSSNMANSLLDIVKYLDDKNYREKMTK